MNRAEKRRQQKLAEKAAKKTADAHQALSIAKQYHAAGQFSQAESIYQKVLRTDPSHLETLHLLGALSLQVGKYDVAVELITRALALKPDFSEAHANLGSALQELGRMDEAITSFQKALAIKPGYLEAHINLGNVLQDLGRMDEAATSFQNAIAINPGFAAAHNNLGLVLSELGRFNESVSSFQKALNIQPDSIEAHNNQGRVLQRLGRLDDAVSNFEQALNINPNSYLTHINLALALNEQGQFNEAVDSFQKALAINSDMATAHNDLGLMLNEVGRLNDSVASYREALALKPVFTEAHANLGSALQDMGLLDEALVSFQEALRSEPERAKTFNNIGFVLLPMCCENTESYRDTLSIEKIIDNLPTPPEPDIIRFQLHSLLGGKAQEAWQRVVNHMPDTQGETIDNTDKTTTPSVAHSEKTPEREMVALLHFGRSGSGYLHSLLDGHQCVSTLPGVYMSGFFGREVWKNITSEGYQGIPEQFSRLYEVLFDARCPERVPPAFVGDGYANHSVGIQEGFVEMGINRDTPLTLDRDRFQKNLREITDNRKDINHGQLFEAIHHAYEKTLGNDFRDKSLIFYHLHKNDPYSMANYLKYFPKARLLTILRNPVQSCESWALVSVNSKRENGYKIYREVVDKIISMLMDLNCPSFLEQDAVAVRLEDIKAKPEQTMRLLCAFLEIKEAPSLYQSTMQGLQWWGDPSSSLFGRAHNVESWEDDPIRAETGVFFSTTDQLILATIFYPLCARFGYVEQDDKQFKKDLATIRPLLDEPLSFEKKLEKTFPKGNVNLQQTSPYKSLHATLTGLWRVLDENGTYPYMVKPLRASSET